MVPEPEDTVPAETGADTQTDQNTTPGGPTAPADDAAGEAPADDAAGEAPGADAAAPEAAPEVTPKAAAKATPAATAGAGDDEEEDETPGPEPTPGTCRGIAIGQLAFEEAVLAGEFDGSDFLFYLEPAGVLNANLICSRAYPAENIRAGILMTKAARDTKTVFFNDGINPDKYELHFPKEFGYVKSMQHFQPASREHAKYPWSKKY